MRMPQQNLGSVASADLDGTDLARVGVGAPGFHGAAGILERRAIPVVVPDVPAVTPIAVRLSTGAPAGVNPHGPVGPQPVGPELVDVPGPVTQRPVRQRNRASGAVEQLDPLGVQARVRAPVRAWRVVEDLPDHDWGGRRL